MTSKRMGNYSGGFLLIAVLGILYEAITGDILNGVFPMLVMSGVYGVGSVIVERLDNLTNTLNKR